MKLNTVTTSCLSRVKIKKFPPNQLFYVHTVCPLTDLQFSMTHVNRSVSSINTFCGICCSKIAICSKTCVQLSNPLDRAKFPPFPLRLYNFANDRHVLTLARYNHFWDLWSYFYQQCCQSNTKETRFIKPVAYGH